MKSVHRNGYPTPGTPVVTDDGKRVFMSTMDTLAFDHRGHEIHFCNYSNLFLLLFELATTQASPDFRSFELTSVTLSLVLNGLAALPGKTGVC